MHRRLTTTRIFNLSLALLAMVLTSGCETTSNWLKGRKTAEPEDIVLNAPNANEYLHELEELASGNPTVEAEILADAEAAATLTPDPSTRLRYALILATPGHPGTNLGEARHMLQQLLQEPEMMTSAEVSLARIYLANAGNQADVASELYRVRSSSSQAASSQEAAASRRISQLQTENERLRESLAEAESKLEALSSIERSIRQQADNNDPQ